MLYDNFMCLKNVFCAYYAKKIPIIIGIFLLLCSVACSQEKREEEPIAERTVLIYMAADNNLYAYAIENIKNMLTSELPNNCNLVVYLDTPSWLIETKPQLYHIQSGELISVKQYLPHNSASAEVLQEVIGDVLHLFKAQSYGLVLWSHGTGWLPESAFEDLKSQSTAAYHTYPVKSFGKDGAHEINIVDLANAIPIKFDYILFDACLMSCMEVLYQLRNKADVIIASPTEILAEGFPYDKITPLLFGNNYIGIAQAYMAYYKNKSDALLQSATIAVVDTKQLIPFAATMKNLIKNGNVVTSPDNQTIQSYDRLDSSVFYDLQDCLEHSVVDEQILNINQQLSTMVLYNGFTPFFLQDYPILKSCGLSVYISSSNKELDEYYKRLDWYRDTGLLFH